MPKNFSDSIGNNNLVSMLRPLGKRPGRLNKRLRRLRLEQLENRMLMAADLSNEMNSFEIADLGDDDHPDHGYVADTRPSSEDNDETNWVLRLDAATLADVLALTTPAVLGVFTPQTLSFTTLANGMPVLNSLLGSPTSVFLDFDGDTTTNTQAYDVDGSPTTFNAAEQKTIAEAWRHIATYVAMFDTDVTTVQPATAQPKAWAAIGNNIVGGYCGVNVFPNTQPRCFNQSGDARTRQSGIAHEVGHNFGLSHQSDFDLFGAETADYSSGYDELHVPIMGVDFAQRVRKWAIGHTANPSGLQDDVNVIRNKIVPYQAPGGDGFRADDFGGTIATATALTSMNDVQYASGIIERMSDVDAFSFNSNGQSITVSALADFPSGVDLKLEIYDALGVLVAAKDAPTLNDQEITLVLSSGTYYALVSSHGNYGDLGTYNVAVRSLPTGWVAGDVGVTGITGFSQFHSSTNSFILGASGADIATAGTADEMQFARQTLTGDGTIIARVASLVNTTGNAKAGIEIRETTGGTAKHVALTPTATQGVKFIRRATVGGTSTTTSSAAAAFAPVWVRLQRVGNLFTASTSANGTTWTTLGTDTIAMNATVQIGLVATAQNDRLFTVAEFENVTVTGNLGVVTPTPNALPAPTGVTVTRSTGADLTISWANQASETGYRVERSIDGVVFTTAGTTAADVTTFQDTGLVGTMRYFYQVRALDGSGASVPSTIVKELNRPSAVTRLELTSYTETQIVLDWIETSGETGYRIERSPDGVTYTTLATVGANIPSYTNSGLTAATSFFYRVTPTSALGDGQSTVISGATRMAQVANLAFSSILGNAITLTWTDLTIETGYLIQRSTNGTSFSDLTNLPAGTTSYTDSTVTPGNEYYYRVLGTVGQSRSLFNLVFTASPTITPLPTPWIAQDIGTVSGSGVGATTFTSGTSTFKVVSSGAAISGNADSFRFTHQQLDGDGSITARVATLEDTGGGNTRFGVMFRENLATNSRFAMMALREGNTGTAQFSSRATVGGAATTASDIVRNAPYWVRVTRAGNVFTGFTSSDGTTWLQIGQATIAMSSTLFVGLAATSGTSGTAAELNSATATNVTLTGDLRTATVAGRQVFYNRSTSTVFGDGSGNPINSIDSTKQALLPGQTVGFANYTNYSRGLNGIVIDVNGLDTATVADFQFATWDGISVAGFVPFATPPSVTVLPGVGAGGSNRVKLDFPDNAVRNTWLRITVLANANTDLFTNDVFYFGHALGDTALGNVGVPIIVRVNATDTSVVRQNQSIAADSVAVTNVYDFNKDGRVNATDTSIVRQNQSNSLIGYFTAASSSFLASDAFAFNGQSVSAPSLVGSTTEMNNGIASQGFATELSPLFASTPQRFESKYPTVSLPGRSVSKMVLENASSTGPSQSSNSFESIDAYFKQLGLRA